MVGINSTRQKLTSTKNHRVNRMVVHLITIVFGVYPDQAMPRLKNCKANCSANASKAHVGYLQLMPNDKSIRKKAIILGSVLSVQWD